MLNAPNGRVWACGREIKPHDMPPGYILYRDEGGSYWWERWGKGPHKQGRMFDDKWAARRDAIEDSKSN
jgi:hypothetical protein